MKSYSFIDEIVRQVVEYTEKNKLQIRDSSLFVREIYDSISSALLDRYEPQMDILKAENAVLEVIDEKTGLLFRRYLELNIVENSNGLRITGEDISGKEQQIAFLSQHAIEKINELQGKGPDKPRCKD